MKIILSPNPYRDKGLKTARAAERMLREMGANPIFCLPFSVDYNATIEMPKGIQYCAMQEELDRCGLLDSIQFTGSTEDNMRTLQTGIGVTVVGLVSDAALRLGRTRPGDAVYCAGVPQSGIIEHYSERDGTVAKISTVAKLRELDFVHEILPVGSKGALYEAGQLAECVGRRFLPVEQPPVDLKTSAGSCTAVLVSLPEESGAALAAELDIPCFFIGRIQ